MKKVFLSIMMFAKMAWAYGQCETMASGYYNTTEVCTISGGAAYTTEIKSSGPGLVEILNVAASGDTLFGTIDCATRMVTVPDQTFASGNVIVASGVFNAAYDVFTFTFAIISGLDTNYCTSTYNKYATGLQGESSLANSIHVRYDNLSEMISVDLPSGNNYENWYLQVLNAQGSVLLDSGPLRGSSKVFHAPLHGRGVFVWRYWNERGEFEVGKFVAH